jgi:AraC-like DNA-binding protein
MPRPAPPPTATYTEAPAPPALADRVACLWTRVAGDAPHTAAVVPDGCVDLMWITDRGASQLVVAGPDTRGHDATLSPGGTIAGVRLAPGAAADVVGLPLHTVRNERPDLADLWGRDAADALAEVAAAAPHPEHALADAVASRAGQPDPAMRHVARRLGTTDAPSPVRGLADDMGLSERQLHRRCTAAFGYGPKTLHRVLRFQAALALARQGRDLSAVAYDCGYADQAHLARDVSDLAGVPLTTLLAS